MKNKVRTNKKAQGHVEMILSFTIFVGFLVFIFIFLNPFAQIKEKDLIKGVQTQVLNEIQEDIGRLSVIVITNGDCYNSSIFSNYQEVGEKIIVIQNAVNIRKYDIYYGESLTQNIPACLSNIDYTVGTYSKEKMFIYEKIQKLGTDYTSDYNGLKNSLGITDDFVFELKKLDNSIEIDVEKNIPVGVEVQASNVPIRVINSQGVITEYILNIRVW